jgi:hypothetical protein
MSHLDDFTQKSKIISWPKIRFFVYHVSQGKYAAIVEYIYRYIKRKANENYQQQRTKYNAALHLSLYV